MKSKITSLILMVIMFTFFTAAGQDDKATMKNDNTVDKTVKTPQQNDKAIDQNNQAIGQNDDANKLMWPVSSTNEQAKKTFNEALQSLWNARFPEYEQKIEQTIKEDPNFFLAHANRALVIYPGDKEKGHELLHKVLELPQNKLTGPEKKVRMVISNLNEKKTDDIKANLKDIISSYPDILQSYEFAMGVSRFVLDDPKLGAEYAKQAVEKFPNHGPAWNQLGYYYMDQNQLDMAEQAFNNYLRLNPNEANAHDSYADFCMKKGNYDEARRHYETAVQMGMTASRERAEKARAMAQGGAGEEEEK